LDNSKKYTKVLGLIIFIAILLSSCFKPIAIEGRVLSEEKIIAVLKDIHVAEAMLTETADRRAKDSLARTYYPQIFRIHDVRPEDFDQTMNALFTDPIALDSIYTKIIKSLSDEKAELLKAAAPKK